MLKGRIQKKFKRMLFTFSLETRTLFLNLCTDFITVSLFKYFDFLLTICIERDVLGLAISAIFFKAYCENEYCHTVAFWLRKKFSAK